MTGYLILVRHLVASQLDVINTKVVEEAVVVILATNLTKVGNTLKYQASYL